MFASTLYFPTLKEIPSDAELISHQLMLRAGLIRKLASGLYTWLPLGLKVLHNVSKIVREEMEKIGAQEVLMPAVQPAEIWQESKRWDEYGKELLRLNDRHGREFCFGPTHEEVVTDLIRDELSSYKNLPKTFYQIQSKFRDEIRPRFGVMRSREFLMKDAYSFHLNNESLEKTYNDMHKAYTNIFNRIGLEFRSVLADTGSIGGNKSQEFHVLASSGEDAIAFCPSSEYAANVELATANMKDADKLTINSNDFKKLETFETPDITSTHEQAMYMGIEPKQAMKTYLVEGATKEHPVVALVIRGDHSLNHVLAAKSPLVANPLQLISEEKLQVVAKCKSGFVGAVGLNLPIIADKFAMHMQNFSCGANQDNKHYINVNWGRDLPEPVEILDLREVTAGDLSPDGKGTLEIARGIEVGHIFMLGDKYSKSMEASVLDENGKSKHLQMGCYGIGVSRVVAATIEQNHDTNGIIWPSSIAPFKVAIVAIDYHRNDEVKQHCLSLYNKLNQLGIDVLLDDRNERPGIKFKDMDLIGIPHRIVISSKTIAAQEVEYKQRGGAEAINIALEKAITMVAASCAKDILHDREAVNN